MKTRLTAALGGLLVVAAAAVGCGSNSPGSPASPTPTLSPTPGQVVTLTITITEGNGADAYQPDPSSIAVGQTVAFFNDDTTVHTATADNGAFDTGPIAPGTTSAPITMMTAGTFKYHCSIHATLTGTLTVTGQ